MSNFEKIFEDNGSIQITTRTLVGIQPGGRYYLSYKYKPAKKKAKGLRIMLTTDISKNIKDHMIVISVVLVLHMCS